MRGQRGEEHDECIQLNKFWPERNIFQRSTNKEKTEVMVLLTTRAEIMIEISIHCSTVDSRLDSFLPFPLLNGNSLRKCAAIYHLVE